MLEAGDTLQERVEEQAAPDRKRFGTFSGVFTPTLLTILGVIMYLREGWVVGNAGLLGAWLIILMAFVITTSTGLSLSSITTNIRIGAGGAYSVISQSLGLEVGGSVGIPLYLAQALAVTMYIFGFREGWLYIFPDHPAILVDLLTFAALFAIGFVSAGLAFRIQYVIMAVIAASLVSVFGSFLAHPLDAPVTWWGSFPGAPETGFQGVSVWVVFAVFFPAATGIMAGANMSGDLENPRRSIPVGTLAAIALSLAIYLALAYWLARAATTEELISNYTIMIDRALWPPAVLAGLLGATFSSGLASLVGAPRILQALGDHRVLPGSGWLARRNRAGEPRNAMLLTGAIVLAALLLRDLNAIAPLVTMFFLITYAMVNAVVLIEQSLGLVSFRPLLRVPRLVPLVGAAGCLFAMLIVNPLFGLVAVGVVVGIYAALTRRRLKAPFGDMRSGLFVAVAEWAAKRVAELPASTERVWKPNLLVPVRDPREVRGLFRLLHAVAYPKGSVKVVGLAGDGGDGQLSDRLPVLAHAFREEGVFASWAVVEAERFDQGLVASMQALRGAFFRPNILFLQLPESGDRDEDLQLVIRKARENRLGIMLFANHPQAGLGREQVINLWVSEQGPEWRLSMDLGNLDLAILLAYKLKRNWNARLNLITTVSDPDQVSEAECYLRNLVDMARIPDAAIHVANRRLDGYLTEAPQADLNIFGLRVRPDFEFVRCTVTDTRAACIFVRDSGEESALA